MPPASVNKRPAAALMSLKGVCVDPVIWPYMGLVLALDGASDKISIGVLVPVGTTGFGRAGEASELRCRWGCWRPVTWPAGA